MTTLRKADTWRRAGMSMYDKYHCWAAMQYHENVCSHALPPSARVMTRSTPGPDPVPASAQPRTDPRRFIANALRVASRHVTRSRRVHPHDTRTRHGTCGP